MNDYFQACYLGIMALLSLLLVACETEQNKAPVLFTQLSADQTGIDFSNDLKDSESLNILTYLYYFNGGGVALGDLNNDGLSEVFFTGNQVKNRLYLNKGNLLFEDVTEAAGLEGLAGWTTGTNMADVNGDGLLDIYVCQVSNFQGLTGHNQLYINQGNLQFEEQAAQYGLDFSGFSTQSCFFDYDRDGDLDMFLLNHSVHDNDTYRDTSIRQHRHPTAGDRLFRNDGSTFTDVTFTSGIYSSEVGYGLGIVASDLNQDGWPDLYIGNDFHENDYLYLNNGDGTFTESLESMIGHSSRFSMGVEVGDINNDLLPDILSLDMKPDREEILKTSEGPEQYQIYTFKLSYGYNPQYPRNALQLNRGVGAFSEIGQYAGIDATDWSWSALFADFDLDGFQDIYITNGIYRRPNDMDYIKFISDQDVIRAIDNGIDKEDLKFIEHMPQVPIANAAFRNLGNLQFEKETQNWGLDQAGFSQGAAYGDLDNDGDLDLVVNNMQAPAFVYRNEAHKQGKHFLKITLLGKGKNPFAIGAKLILTHQGEQRYREMFTVRGFQSSVEPHIHVGLGDWTQVDSIIIMWPDGHSQVLTDIAIDQHLEIRQSEDDLKPVLPLPRPQDTYVEAIEAPVFQHQENTFNDYRREPLMLHMLSTQGPALAAGDVNGDGLEDVFVGGAKNQGASLFIQQASGQFRLASHQPWSLDSFPEDVDAIFFDIEGDGDLDLYIARGGNEYQGESQAIQDRLFLNDGAGVFSPVNDRLPPMFVQTGCVRPGDFDMDGDLDLFVGGRSMPFRYGLSPRSFLLENDGGGYFRDVTEEKAPGLKEAGMVCDAAWADLNGDGQTDLVVGGEWMPLRFFKNTSRGLEEITEQAGLGKSNGMWNCLKLADLDGDGDQDLVAGNLGLNSVLKASPEEPAQLYIKDFDGNGSIEQILCFYKHGISYPFPARDEILSQLVNLRKRFVNYRDYAEAGITDIFDAETLADAEVREIYTLASSWFENDGAGHFSLHQLPAEAQFAPMMDLAVRDLDKDGIPDILLAGNLFDLGPNIGRYDADLGVWLKGTGQGGYVSLQPYETGWTVQGQARKLLFLQEKEGPGYIMVGRNNERLGLWKLKQ